MLSILCAGVLALVGLVVGPWLLVLARAVTRERAGRVRAEERAEMANHLHDSVLQTLTLIQKRARQADGHGEVARLARTTERELRRWLYARDRHGSCDSDGDGDGDDKALRQVAVEPVDGGLVGGRGLGRVVAGAGVVEEGVVDTGVRDELVLQPRRAQCGLRGGPACVHA